MAEGEIALDADHQVALLVIIAGGEAIEAAERDAAEIALRAMPKLPKTEAGVHAEIGAGPGEGGGRIIVGRRFLAVGQIGGLRQRGAAPLFRRSRRSEAFS